jgi:hypothetical protein
MKKKRGLTIKINFSNRWLYTFIVLGILAVVAVGVYAYGTSTPSTFGHSIEEIDPPSPCSNNQILRWDGNALICSNEITIPPQEIQYYSMDVSNWNMDSTATKSVLTTLNAQTYAMLGMQIFIFDDNGYDRWVSGDVEGLITLDPSQSYKIDLIRKANGRFDSTNFDSSVGKRATLVIIYREN